MSDPQQVLDYWFDAVGPKGWFDNSAALDAEIRAKFHDTWQEACAGRLAAWLTSARGALAFVLVTDQFSRNMFRDTAEAFASDKAGLAAAKSAIDRGWDIRVDASARAFFYMPLMHSENLCDQDRCVRLICERLPETGERTLLHARAHRAVIRKFGRFPTRNAALSRPTTAGEADYLAQGGYAEILRDLQGSVAA